MSNNSEVTILGVRLDVVTAPELIVRLRQGLDAGRRQMVVTVTNEMIINARRHPAYQKVINQATWRIPDTTGTVWAAKYLSLPLRGPLKGLRAYTQALRTLALLLIWPSRTQTVLPGTIPGSDLSVDLAGVCEEFGYRLFLLGAGDGVAVSAAEKLRSRFPELQVVGAEPGSPDPDDDERILEVITRSRANVILVAFGVPKQELWIARNLEHLPAPVLAVGVGGTFDYLAGTPSVSGGRPAKQPPRFVRRRGLEWLWRLITQPSRWRRIMTALPVFVWRVIAEKRAQH